MQTLNRREMMVAMAAVAALGGAAQAESETVLAQSKVYRFNDLPVVPRDHGQKDQSVLDGTLATGEALEVHETTLPPGQTPHAPHRHRHSELMLVRDGLLEFNNDGRLERAGPGGVFFVGSNVLHGVKCVGDVAANYYVIAIGRDRAVRPVSG
ncbi:MAG: cupin domain-containing protein [Granulicella sp.]